MKKLIFSMALILTMSKLLAQDCSQYMFMKKNRIIQSTSYNEKGEVLRKMVSTVTELVTTNGVTTATVVSEYLDKNGKANGKRAIYYKCDGGKFMMDMGPSDKQQGNDNVKFTVSSLEYPTGMKVGDHLNGATSEMTSKFGNITTVANSQITDRMVVGKENITTPAGTWVCLKITYKTTVTVKGYKMTPQVEESTEWYVPNFGIVKFQVLGLTTEITSIK